MNNERETFSDYLAHQDSKEPELLPCNYCEDYFPENELKNTTYKGIDTGKVCPECLIELKEEIAQVEIEKDQFYKYSNRN